MAKFVVLGLEGDDVLYIVDINGGTVTQAPRWDNTATGFPRCADQGRVSGYTIIKGVNLAVAVDALSDTTIFQSFAPPD